MVVGLGAALLAAVLFGVSAVMQAVASRRYGLVSWLMGVVVLIYLAGWLLHLVAIALLPLYLAQVGIAASLVVTSVVASSVVGEPLEGRHWAAIAAMVLGLTMLVAAAGDVGHNEFDTSRTVALYLGVAVTLVLGLAVLRSGARRTGVLLGALGGVAYGGSPLATRALVDPHRDVETILPALAIGLYGLLGFWLYSVALRRTSVTAATAPLVLLETVLPAAVGLLLFGDQVRPGWWPLALTGFFLSTVGAVMLSGAEARLERIGDPRLQSATEDSTP